MPFKKTTSLIGATIANSVGYSCIVLIGGTGLLLQNAINCDAVSCSNTSSSSLNSADTISNMQVGWLTGAPLLTGSLLRIPCTLLGDRYGHKGIIIALLFLSLGGAILLTTYAWIFFPWDGRNGDSRMTASSYPVLFVAALLIGCGATVYSVGIPHVSYWYPNSGQGLAIGIYGGVGSIAPAAFSLILAGLLSEFSVPPAYLGLVIAMCIGIVAYAILGRDSEFYRLRRSGLDYESSKLEAANRGQELIPDRNFKASIGMALKNPALWAFVVLFLASFGGFIAFSAWIPTYIGGLFPKETTTASGNTTSIPLSIVAAFVFIAGLTRIATGIASDYFSPSVLLFIGLILQTVGQATLVGATLFPLAVAAIVVIALGFGTTMATSLRLLPVRVPKCSAAIGIVATCGSIGGFFFPPMIASFVDVWGHDGYRYGFVTVLVVTGLGLAAMLYLFLTRHRAPGSDSDSGLETDSPSSTTVSSTEGSQTVEAVPSSQQN